MTRDPSRRIAGVVLAAGTSSRMGQDKLLLRVGGVSVLRRAVAAACTGGLDPVLVVLRHLSECALDELGGLSCTPILNPEYGRGMNSSVRAGISAVPADASGAVLMLADMPFVGARMVRQLVDRHRVGRAQLVVSAYGEVLAPPIFYPRDLFGELVSGADGDGCGKRVVKQHRRHAVEVQWPASLLTDLDSPADFERVRAIADKFGELSWSPDA